jgi:hypothetical protein
MRKAFFFLVLASFVACNSDKDAKVKSVTTNDPAMAEGIKYPPVDNSIKFEIADASITAGMLEVYKGWEDNNLDLMKKHMADSVMIVAGDGTITYGDTDTVFAQMKVYRDNYTSMKPGFHSFVSLKSTDKNDTWFLMWYKEYQTDKKGKTDTVELMETWKLNKEGKVTNMYQYVQYHPTSVKK